MIVAALKPTNDATARIVRLFNATDQPAQATLTWTQPGPSKIYRSNLGEERGALVSGSIDLPAWGLVTLRAE